VLPSFALGLLLPPLVASAQRKLGFVQFQTTAGVAILIDGQPVGTSEVGGLVVKNLAVGPRRFEARKEGFVPQFGVVMVESDAITLRRLDGWQPAATVSLDPVGFGTLVVETIPVEATIVARQLGWPDKALKTDATFVARELPAGRQKFTFCTTTKCLDYSVRIPKGSVRKILVDFEPGEIHDLTRDLFAAWQSAAKKCGRSGDAIACTIACEHDAELNPTARSFACEMLDRKGEPPKKAELAEAEPVPASMPFVADTCGIDPNAAPGSLSVASREPVEVYLGDRLLGTTPIDELEVPAGCHELTVRAGPLVHHLSVRVEPKKLRSVRLTF
jgi:hypothetical protein